MTPFDRTTRNGRIGNADGTFFAGAEMLYDRVSYTPYEGMELQGWPEQVYSRGRCVVRDNTLQVERGTGEYIARGRLGPLTNRPAPSLERGRFNQLVGLGRGGNSVSFTSARRHSPTSTRS